jgi:signal transduction histidine kinase
LARINRELEDTNRGVVALYAELDEKASHLRRADEMKSRFLSNMSHEFRTPLNSILALSGLLLDRADGELTSEQDKQVGFIRKGAETLMELVNDLLDLAKIEAGKVEVQPVDFEVAKLFSALRGMLRPLLVTQSVGLAFEDPGEIPCLYNDEGKLSQILRNFISNALKFTEQGVISVAATFNKADQTVTFSVADTGMGITAEDQSKIFEEFVQLDNPAQRKIKGTGLGLPLCRKLATLLNGKIGRPAEYCGSCGRVPSLWISFCAEKIRGAGWPSSRRRARRGRFRCWSSPVSTTNARAYPWAPMHTA